VLSVQCINCGYYCAGWALHGRQNYLCPKCGNEIKINNTNGLSQNIKYQQAIGNDSSEIALNEKGTTLLSD